MISEVIMIIKKEKKTITIDKIILIVNVVFAGALLLSYLAPTTDPRDFALIAVLGFAYQILFIINILFLFYWIIRLKIYALISITSILLGFTIIERNIGFNFSSSENRGKTTNTIKVMQYNVRGFNGIDKFDNKPIGKEVAHLVMSSHPDVVDLEEFNEFKLDSGTNVKAIEDGIKSNYHYFKVFKPYTKREHYVSGIAIFTKYPIVDTGCVPSNVFLPLRAVYIDIKYDNKILRVYALHLEAVDVGPAKAGMLKGKLLFSKASFIVNRLKEAFVKRSDQVSQIKEHMSNCPYPYIVTGDFNDTPISFAVNQIGNGLKNAFVEKGNGLGTTFYSFFPKLHIDYIFDSPQFNILTYWEIDKKLSDHKPILSDLQLK